MFIAHFSVGLAAKKIVPNVSLGWLFLAGQLLDLIWPVLVLAGVETVSVEPGATVVAPFDFSYYPYSHSLLMVLVYSLMFFLIGLKVFGSVKSGIVLGFVVFSHWIFDYISHRPDLPLLFSGDKVGLGLWNTIVGTVLFEGGIFLLGVFIYLKSTKNLSKKNLYIFWSMIIFLILIYIGNIFGPKPPVDISSAAIAGPGLATWLFVAWAFWADPPRKV